MRASRFDGAGPADEARLVRRDMEGGMLAEKGDFEIDDDLDRLDFDFVVRSLQNSYWAENLDADRIVASFRQALPFGLYRRDGAQIGFARVVTDFVRFAWLSDLFIDGAARGSGLGVWFAETILAHPDLKTVERWLLATRDAHTLYAKLGFVPASPDRYMVLAR